MRIHVANIIYFLFNNNVYKYYISIYHNIIIIKNTKMKKKGLGFRVDSLTQPRRGCLVIINPNSGKPKRA